MTKQDDQTQRLSKTHADPRRLRQKPLDGAAVKRIEAHRSVAIGELRMTDNPDPSPAEVPAREPSETPARPPTEDPINDRIEDPIRNPDEAPAEPPCEVLIESSNFVDLIWE